MLRHPILYRVLRTDEPRPAKVVRICMPVKKWADFHYPKGGYRCPNKAWEVSVVMNEVATTTLPHPRVPRNMCEARCPFCAKPLRLVRCHEVVELVPVVEC